MSDADKASLRARFEKMGVNQVRAQLLEWTGQLRLEAGQWLAEKDHESARLAEASRAEQLEIARSAEDVALEANKLAAEANSVAREANSIAREAAASAALSARAARINNTIATLALVAATIAMAISVISIFVKSH